VVDALGKVPKDLEKTENIKKGTTVTQSDGYVRMEYDLNYCS